MSERAANKTFEDGLADDVQYKRARQVYFDDLGNERRAKLRAQRVATISLVIALVSLVGLIVQSTKASVIPYLVEVESTGQVRLVGTVTTQEWSLSESTLRVELERWVRNLRSISTDARIFKQRITYVRTHSTQAANLQLERYLEDHRPFERFGKEARVVHIDSMTKLAGSEQAWRVHWSEKIFGPEGEDLGEEEYVGEFHLTLTPPETEDELRINPLGVFVAFFDLDKRSKKK